MLVFKSETAYSTHMTTLTKLSGFCLLAVACMFACTGNNLNLPEPAQSVDGTYLLLSTNGPLPLKADKIQMYIKRIVNDSVEVMLRGTINGQQADSLNYKRAFVQQVISVTGYRRGCVSHRVYLTTSTGANVLTTSCSEINVITLSYLPTGQQQPVYLRFGRQ